jgi:tetratricopeptide (TPR) repeat protein
MPDGTAAQNIRVRLEAAQGEVLKDGVTDSGGVFEVVNLNTGNYVLSVPSDGSIYETATERIELNRLSPDTVSLNVYLVAKREATSRTGARRTTSVKEADSAIPKKARLAYQKAVKLEKRGRTEEAVNALKLAVSLYHAYLQAYNDLGVAYMKMGLLPDATSCFERALEIDPRAFNPRLNLGITCVRAQEFSKAEARLREALAIDSSSALAHMYLGIVLFKSSELDHGEDELLRAISLGGPDVAVAHYYLGQLYARRDRIADAVSELEAYLKVKPNGDEAARVRELMDELQRRRQ